MVRRKGFVVFFEKFDLNNFFNVNVTYLSKKYNYAVCYCDLEQYKNISNKIKANKDVLSVEESLFSVEHFYL